MQTYLILKKYQKYQNHITCSYGYKLICIHKQNSKPYKSYFGEDPINKFSVDMEHESIYCSGILDRIFKQI